MSGYLKDRPASTPAMLAKAEQLEASRTRSHQLAEESFQRSDTDGFLSQWAHQSGAQVDAANISILRNGGVVAVQVLCDKNGNIVTDVRRSFPHPVAHWTSVWSWDLGRNANEIHGRRWVPMGDKSRVQKKLGLHEEVRYVPGYAKLTAPAGARGLGGCASAYVGRFRSDTDEEV